ncbi:HAMP domain-containing histidine kinase [Clostridium sp. YIM B02505]|uniref:histidine kinase n=1 Tax=Clostridium yunnanense TaxID=2800325 RepID=A0ABS1EQU0_9CLOT|nr:histidine kinase dimerization/phospho-acceptor domain-containing protein [Clostridium yunnanense]MBK1811727.1 HAMP domain-containing histidine kinase [Clostridium yunnanense]
MGIRLKNKNRVLREVLLIVAMLSLATVLIVSVNVITNKEVLEKDGFYKTESFMKIIRNFNSDVVDLTKKYKSEEYIKSEEYAKNLSSDDIEAKRQELVNKSQDESNKLIHEYNNKISEANEKNAFNEADKMKEELNKGLQNLKEDYNLKINNSDNFKKDIIDEKLQTFKDLRKRVDGFKNIKYVLINGDDGTTKANIKYDSNNIKASFKDSTGFYLKVYGNKDSNQYNDIYDCNVDIRGSNSGEGWFYSLVNTVRNSNLTIYMSVPERPSEGDAIYFAYRDFYNLKVRIINEAIVSVVALVIFIISLSMLIYRRKLIKENVIGFKRLPIEIRVIGAIAIIALNISILISYQQYYPYRRLQEISLVEIEAIVGIALTLIILIKFIVPIFYKQARQEMVKKALSWKVYGLWQKVVVYGREFTYMRSIFFKAIVVICITIFILLPLSMFTGIYIEHHLLISFISLFIILAFAAFISIYIFKKLIVLDRIIAGTEKITNGDLNYTIDIGGQGNLSKLANNINNMKAGLKSSIESEIKSERLKTELITNVSHDLKTPLTSIINYVDLLKRNNGSPEDMKKYIDILDRKSQRLKILIEDLFEASKAASGSLEVNMEKVEVTSLLKQTLAEFEEKISEARLDFRINYPEVKLYIMADGKKLWRVFENLINNILKYSLRGTRVYITVNNENGKIKISMKNISAYELDINPEEILERFKRGDQARNTEGSGLGLAIAKSLVELQNGSFNIEIDGDLFKANIMFEEVE